MPEFLRADCQQKLPEFLHKKRMSGHGGLMCAVDSPWVILGQQVPSSV